MLNHCIASSSHSDWFRDGHVTHFGLMRVSNGTLELLEKWYFLFVGATGRE